MAMRGKKLMPTRGVKERARKSSRHGRDGVKRGTPRNLGSAAAGMDVKARYC